MKKREILIVIALILFGISYNAHKKGELNLSFSEGCNTNRMALLDKKFPHDYVQADILKANITHIRIDNLAGNIVVEKTPDNQVRVQPTIRVYHKNPTKADKLAKEISLLVRTAAVPGKTGETLTLRVEPKHPFNYQRCRVYVKVLLPTGVDLDLRNSYGFIDITDCGGKVSIDQRHGDIIANKIASGLRIRNQYGDVTVNDAGALELTAMHCQVSLENIRNQALVTATTYSDLDITNTARVSIDAKYSAINVSNIKEGLSVKNSYETVYLENVGGNINIAGTNCKVIINNAVCDTLTLRNSYKKVEIDGLSAKNVDIMLNHGRLDLAVDKIEDHIHIKNSYSDIAVAYPMHLNPFVTVDVRSGSIVNRTSQDMTLSRENGRSLLNSSRPEAKPQISVTNAYGDVKLEHTGQKTGQEVRL
ncbi:MAG: DUF4097 family beta strand repeat-containing protein [Candidatus Omnitrophota bacterium]